MRIRCVLIAATLALGTACQAEDASLPEPTGRERQALTAFRHWLAHRTSARKNAMVEMRDSHGLVSKQETTGLLDFRARIGQITGTYTYRGVNGGVKTARVENIMAGNNEYVLNYPPTPGQRPWRVMDAMQWTYWTDYERALAYVHDEGRTTVQGRRAGRFTGLVDIVRKRTLPRPPKAGCRTSILAIDLYLDDATGTLLRYDERTLYGSSATTGSSPERQPADLTTYSDFGVPVPSPKLPAPATVEPRPDLRPGVGVTLTARADVRPDC
jgi:hypothetical protein